MFNIGFHRYYPRQGFSAFSRTRARGQGNARGFAARDRERDCWLRRVNVRSNAPEDAVGSDHHSDADNKRDGADHDPSQQ
jgi:hypothetical protein